MATSEVLIFDPIGEGVSAKDVAEAIPAGATEILVRINSPGGDVYQGIAIYSVLKNSGAKVRVRVEGVAASAASLIAMAGDEIEMCDGSFMLVHEPWGGGVGTADDLQAASEDMARMRDSFIAIYAKRTGRSAAEIAALMKEDRLLTAQEAVELGFADSISAGAAAIMMSVLPRKLRAMIAARKEISMAKMADEDKEDLNAKIAALEATVAKLSKKMEDDSDADDDKSEARAEDDGDDDVDPDKKDAKASDDEPDGDEEDDAPPKSRSAKAAARKAGFKAGIAYAREVNDLCSLAGRPAMAASFIRDAMPVADIRKALLKAAADMPHSARIMTARDTFQRAPEAEASKGWDAAIARLPAARTKR